MKGFIFFTAPRHLLSVSRSLCHGRGLFRLIAPRSNGRIARQAEKYSWLEVHCEAGEDVSAQRVVDLRERIAV